MGRAKRLVFFLIAMLMGFGGLFGSLGVLAQDTAAPEVAQPGGDLPGEPSVQLVKVAGGLVDPINVAAPSDGSGRLFVVERGGTIRIIENGELLEEPFLDISNEVKTDFLEQGLLGLAFHPDYAENGRFFVFYSDYRTNGDHYVVEYTVSDDPNVADDESGRVVLAVDDPFINHNGGTMVFGPDGYLYITIGDGGMAGDPYDNSQDLSNLLGKSEFPPGTPVIKLHRLRATWFLHHMRNLVPLNELSKVAGLSTAKTFGHLMRYLPDLPEAEVFAQMTRR